MSLISIKIFFFLILMITFSTCTTGIQTNSNPGGSLPGQGTMTTPASFSQAAVTLGAFSLGGDFPPDIKISDEPGLDSTAFVLTFSPAAVIPIDLDSNPPKVSAQFPILDVSTLPEAAFPNHVLILSPTQGFLLGSTHVIYFNPSTGNILQKLSLVEPINLSQALPYSMPGDCDQDSFPENSVGPGFFAPSFPADMAVANDRLFVTMSNTCFDAGFESFYVQGILLIFDLNGTPPFLTPASKPFLVLPGFNATGITTLDDHLIVTSTGDTSLAGGAAIPQTPSFLAEVDPGNLQISNVLNLGLVAANFQPLAVTSDGASGFIGSSAFSEVYEIDLENFSVLRGGNNPILIFGETDDFMTDQEIAFGDQILFVSSFNHSAVRAVDLTTIQRNVLGTILDFSFESNPGVTGAGPMALRPGAPNVDFTGPDLWVLTGSPGTVSTAVTY